MATLKLGRLQGATFTERGDKFLPRGIRWFMKGFAKAVFWKKGIRYARAWGNHAEKLIIIDGVPCLYGAVKDGFKKRPFTKVYNTEKAFKKLRCYVPIDQFNSEEVVRMYQKAEELKDRPYQFWNFPAWVIYIGSNLNINLFRRERKAENRIYCFEGVARLDNAARPGLHDDYEEITSIYDIEQNKYFVEFKDWRTFIRIYLNSL